MNPKSLIATISHNPKTKNLIALIINLYLQYICLCGYLRPHWLILKLHFNVSIRNRPFWTPFALFLISLFILCGFHVVTLTSHTPILSLNNGGLLIWDMVVYLMSLFFYKPYKWIYDLEHQMPSLSTIPLKGSPTTF